METNLFASSNGSAWQVVPSSSFVLIILGILFFYFFLRHFIFVLMIFDLMLSFLRKFKWFPCEGNRMKAVVHWAIALALFLGFLAFAGGIGWLEFVQI